MKTIILGPPGTGKDDNVVGSSGSVHTKRD
jgi:hypothetical protein